MAVTDRQKRIIILAGLLHDIGKLGQRADQAVTYRKSDYLKNKTDGYVGSYCPTKKDGSGYGYQHVLWTVQFLENYEHKFRELGVWEEAVEGLANLAGKHHQPDQNSTWQGLITLADHWSSGIDRRDIVYNEEDEQEITDKHKINWKSYAHRKVPLHSIFYELCIDRDQEGVCHHEISKQKHAFPLVPLDLKEEKIFKPFEVAQSSVYDKQADYARLWTEFNSAFNQLPDKNYPAFEESLIYLLKKYTWCVPSSTQDMANVSLYDHMRMTAAITGSLYDYLKNMPEAITRDGGRLKFRSQLYPLSLLHVDISGIQKFIYDIASSKAAKSLKGRSFFLNLLLDAVVREILLKTGGSTAQIIYASGGKAFLLLPNTELVNSILETLAKELEQKIWSNYKLSLYVTLAWESFIPAGSDIILSNGRQTHLGELWESVILKSDAYKFRRYSESIKGEYLTFFNPQGVDGGASLENLCEVTGEVLTPETTEYIKDSEEPIRVSRQVYEQTLLGDSLKDNDYIIVKTGEKLPDNFSDYMINPGGLSTYYYLVSKENFYKKEVLIGGAVVLALNDTSLNLQFNDAATGFMFYGGNKMPVNKQGKLKEFSQLCEVDQTQGADTSDISYLGILRMDVDNLGKIFQQGFEASNRSLSAFSTLSFMLDLFFSGYINQLRNLNKYRDQVQILYSGGDDLFVLGRWDKIIEFSAEIRCAFEVFTRRKDLTISGGISIVQHKYPIQKVAAMAGDAEKEAKRMVREINNNTAKKNALNLFNMNIGWEEWEQIKSLKNNMVNLIRQDQLPISLLHRIQNFYISKVNSNGELRYKWLGVYHFGRLKERVRPDDKETKFFLDEEVIKPLLHHSTIGTERYLDLLAAAARWSELALRFIKT